MPLKPKGLGLRVNPLAKIKDKYPIFPVTVWDMDHTDKLLKEHKQFIGDEGLVRDQYNAQMGATYKTSLGANKTNASIFNPSIIAGLLKLYPPPPGGNIYDPFGGGGTRAIVTATQEEGFNYTGVEIRADEIDLINDQVKRIDGKGYLHGTINIIHGNSQSVPSVPDQWADMLITCPPYYDLEKYDGGYGDLSMATTYYEFLDGLSLVIDECYRILKPGALACWVIGLHRDDQGLIPMHHDLARLHMEGFTFVEEIVLHMKNTGSIQRVGNFAKGRNLLIRTHEYCLIFKKVEG